MLFDGMATAPTSIGRGSLKTSSKAFKGKTPSSGPAGVTPAMDKEMQKVAETAVRKIDKELDNYHRMVYFSGVDEYDEDYHLCGICEEEGSDEEGDDCSSDEEQDESVRVDVEKPKRTPSGQQKPLH